jgi:hypothetical protein
VLDEDIRDYGVEATSAATTTTVNVELINRSDSKSFESSELLRFFDDDHVEHKVLLFFFLF